MPVTYTKFEAVALKQVKTLPGVVSAESLGAVTSLTFQPKDRGHGLKLEFATSELSALKSGQVIHAQAVKTTGRIPCRVSVAGVCLQARMEGKGHDWVINVETSEFLP